MPDSEKFGTIKRTKDMFGSFKKLASKVAPHSDHSNNTVHKGTSTPNVSHGGIQAVYRDMKSPSPGFSAQDGHNKPLYGSVRMLQRTASSDLEPSHTSRYGRHADVNADAAGLDVYSTASTLKKSVSVPYTNQVGLRAGAPECRPSLVSSHASSASSTLTTGSLSSTDDLRNTENDLFRNMPGSSDTTSESSPSPESVRRLTPMYSSVSMPIITPPTRNMYACSAAGCHQSFSRYFQLRNHIVQVHGANGVGAMLRTNIEHGYKQERSELVERAELAMVQEAVIEGTVM
eukprot:comp6487_c0_seq1/m.2261 comp6487_c0_seq1/g.2261  ORF comp6487_c0_seq1/g.2261 comp6487_c0_seq1/m.2261 type:complete len:289 (-) comp6487_c0_seq1:65-931(-)